MKVSTVNHLRLLVAEGVAPAIKVSGVSQGFINDLQGADVPTLSSLFRSRMEVLEAQSQLNEILNAYSDRITAQRVADGRHFWLIRIIIRLYRSIFGPHPLSYDPSALSDLFLATAASFKIEDRAPRAVGADGIIAELKEKRFDNLAKEKERLTRFQWKVPGHYTLAAQVTLLRAFEA